MNMTPPLEFSEEKEDNEREIERTSMMTRSLALKRTLKCMMRVHDPDHQKTENNKSDLIKQE